MRENTDIIALLAVLTVLLILAALIFLGGPKE